MNLFTLRSHMGALLSVALLSSFGCGKEQSTAKDVPKQKVKSQTAETKKAIAASCQEAIDFVCAEIGPSSGVCELMKKTVKKMDATRCDDMLANPQQTLRDMRQMEESRLPLNAEKQALLKEGNPPAFGPKDAPVTVAVFLDFNCEKCIYMAYYAMELGKFYKDKVRVLFRNHPSPESNIAYLAAQAGLAAYDQGKFWEYYRKLYNNQHDMNEAALKRCAKEVGIALKPFSEALENGMYRADVDRDMAIAKQLFVAPAPYFFVNGVRVSGTRSDAMVAASIDAALSQKSGSPSRE